MRLWAAEDLIERPGHLDVAVPHIVGGAGEAFARAVSDPVDIDDLKAFAGEVLGEDAELAGFAGEAVQADHLTGWPSDIHSPRPDARRKVSVTQFEIFGRFDRRVGALRSGRIRHRTAHAPEGSRKSAGSASAM